MLFTHSDAFFLFSWALSMMIIAGQHFHLAYVVTRVNYDKSILSKSTSSILQKIFIFAGGAYFFDALPKIVYLFQSSEILIPEMVLWTSLAWNLCTSYVLHMSGRELVREI